MCVDALACRGKGFSCRLGRRKWRHSCVGRTREHRQTFLGLIWTGVATTIRARPEESLGTRGAREKMHQCHLRRL